MTKRLGVEKEIQRAHANFGALSAVNVVSLDAAEGDSRLREFVMAMLGVLAKPPYWSMKVKIAILTLMTFAALC